MKGKEKIFLIVLSLAVLAVLILTPREDPLEWTHTYLRDDARPYGSRILFELLPSLFDGVRTQSIDLPPYEAAADTSTTGVAYLFLTDVFAPDEVESETLLRFVERGNSLFVAALSIQGALIEALDLRAESYIPAVGSGGIDSVRINLVNPALREEAGFYYGTNLTLTYLDADGDSTNADLLGVYEDGKPNFVRVRYGNGDVYINTAPLAFTNVNMLAENGAAYVYRSLSYLSPERIWWDAYYKPLRLEARTPLRYILSAPALRTAYILLVAGLMLYILFQGKRKQRPIPIVAAERNTTVEFAETVGRLYFHHGDHAGLAHKMMEQFKHYVRSQLQLRVDVFGKVAPEAIAARAGVTQETVEALIADLARVEQGEIVDETSLMRLARRLDAFFSASARSRPF